MGILRDISLWIWRLLPANPILVRVVSAAGKRSRHLWARLLYLVCLVAVFLLGGGLLLGASGGSLADQAKQATRTFMGVSMVQLFLMSFIAPIFCAGAITQEKDSNTYHILLTTPLSNAQIVLGSLFSRIYFVWALLLAGLPVFCITMIYGGVTTTEIFESFGLAACTGLVTGSTAIMISFLRVGTRRTIFAFFVGVAVYLLGVGLIGISSWGQLSVAPASTTVFNMPTTFRMSWLAPIHPFLALFVVTGQTPAPDPSAVYQFGWPAWWLLAHPQYGYMAITLLASGFMVLTSLIYVRRGAKEGETTIFTRLAERFRRRRETARGHAPRRVWRNPIAWREAATRASAGGRSFMRTAFLVIGFLFGVVLLILHHSGSAGLGTAAVDMTRMWITPLVWIEFAVILLVVTNTAATTLTREKESQTIELLLSTPLTSRYIIAGMLQGLVRLVIPLIAVPTLTIALFAVFDMFRWGTTPVTTVEAVFLIPLQMIAFAALAAMIGLHFSLLSKKTVQAVMISTGIVMGAAGLLTLCGMAMQQTNEYVAGVILPFTPVLGIQSLLDPWRIVQNAADLGYGSTVAPSQVLQFRVTRAIFTLASAGVYLAITFALYNSMVRGFDMTVRRQSA